MFSVEELKDRLSGKEFFSVYMSAAKCKGGRLRRHRMSSLRAYDAQLIRSSDVQDSFPE